MCERVGHHPGVLDRGPEGAVDQDVVLGRPVPPPGFFEKLILVMFYNGGEPRGRMCIRVFEEGVGHHKVVVDVRRSLKPLLFAM